MTAGSTGSADPAGTAARAGIAAELERLRLPALPDALPAPVVDDHTHLDAIHEMSGLDPELNLAASASVGVTRVVQVGCDLASSQWAADFAADHEQVVAAVAIHPNDAARLVAREGAAALDSALDRIAELAGLGQVRAVGETGLDYYRTHGDDDRAVQRRAFAAHIEIAKATGRTLVIHDRDAHDDVLAVLDAEGWPQRTVLHCFSGGPDFARACLEHGAWLSFGGSVTFKPNAELRSALALAPPQQILVETDAPYLTPVPLRGRPNAPYLVPHTLRFMAGVHGPDAQDLAGWCRRIDHNTDEAYGGHWGPADAPGPARTASSPAGSTTTEGPNRHG